mgnify:CR=1 FL=1
MRIAGQRIAGGIIGGVSYAADCYVNDKEMKLDEALLSVGMGVVSGQIGNDGANKNMVLTTTIESTKKTIVRETRRANQQFAQKAIKSAASNCKNTLCSASWDASIRFTACTSISNTAVGVYSGYNIFPNVPAWAPWKLNGD